MPYPLPSPIAFTSKTVIPFPSLHLCHHYSLPDSRNTPLDSCCLCLTMEAASTLAFLHLMFFLCRVIFSKCQWITFHRPPLLPKWIGSPYPVSLQRPPRSDYDPLIPFLISNHLPSHPPSSSHTRFLSISHTSEALFFSILLPDAFCLPAFSSGLLYLLILWYLSLIVHFLAKPSLNFL